VKLTSSRCYHLDGLTAASKGKTFLLGLLELTTALATTALTTTSSSANCGGGGPVLDSGRDHPSRGVAVSKLPSAVVTPAVDMAALCNRQSMGPPCSGVHEWTPVGATSGH
jgi:hypothetical protein